MPNSDDEGDSCVLVGTPLVDLIPEDAKFSVKAKRQDEQIVTDEKGRQRFHGAFTGGFSAGYFNSVGSKEGWAPSTFKSTRSEKNDKKIIQRPEDFMDEEDFGEHGIAPKTLKVTTNYKDDVKSVSLSSQNYLANSIDLLIRPVRNTIGVKMARKMGWREGQGIGPRIKRKLRKLKTKIYHEPGRKIYGVALPTESDGEDDEDIDEDEYLVSQFDVNEFQFEIKEDLFGLGYKRLDVQDLFSGGKNSTPAITSGVSESPAASLLFPMIDQKKASKSTGIKGHAFGGGDYDDDDDFDVYKQDSIELYNFDLDGKNQKETKKLLEKNYGFGAFEDDAMILKKFKLCETKLQPVKVFKGPQVPTDFNLKHKLADSTKTDAMNTYLKTASQRAEVLNEPCLKPDSIFDLISSEDKKFLDKVKLKHGIIKLDNQQNETDLKQKQIEDEKAKRYEKFISLMKQNIKEPYSQLDTSNLTEWEKEQEKEEFIKKYQQHTKQIEQAKLMTSKFVSTKVLNEQNEEVEISKTKEETVSQKQEEEHVDSKLVNVHRAAREKKFGKQTRTEYEWRPHPTVCKRFNVPNPYPISAHDQTYGTIGSESSKKTISSKDKFSMFEALAASTRFDKEKTRSLFDDLNAEAVSVNLISPSHAKILEDKSQLKTIGKIETEFETSKHIKTSTSEKKSEYSIINEKTPIIIKEPETSEIKETISNNIYLQERPEEIDLFKAIFENEEDEEDEQQVEKEKKDSEGDSEPEITNDSKIDVKTTAIIPSTVNEINLNDVKKYLKPNESEFREEKKIEDEEDNKRIIFKKPESKKKSSDVELFSKLVKSLAKETKKQENSSTSSSTSDSDSVEEIVYEEVSISKKESSSDAKKHKKKKKKKKHHKKKSKKSKD